MKKYIIFLAAAVLAVSCSHTEKAPNHPNMIANVDPFSIGSVDASLDQFFSLKLKEVTVEVVFDPRENEVVLEWSHNMGHFRQIWNEPGRRLFIEGLKRYNDDFTRQNLVDKYNKSRAAYGKFKGQFQWKPLRFSATYRSLPVVEVGYRFRDNAPYFSINQMAAKEESGTNRSIGESPASSMYFTRAQGEELANLFDQAFLLKSLEGKESLHPADKDRDEYYQQNNNATPEHTNDTVPEQKDKLEDAEPDI
ncbi:MAG: hypothetical protein FWG29_04005 [Treponema sp.]|nr:hypothetical protein [Treponema sp.]